MHCASLCRINLIRPLRGHLPQRGRLLGGRRGGLSAATPPLRGTTSSAPFGGTFPKGEGKEWRRIAAPTENDLFRLTSFGTFP